jgi:hypothetical protein
MVLVLYFCDWKISSLTVLSSGFCYNVIYGYQIFTIPVPFAGRLSLNINGHSVTPFTLVTTTTSTTVRELSCIVEWLMLVLK